MFAGLEVCETGEKTHVSPTKEALKIIGTQIKIRSANINANRADFSHSIFVALELYVYSADLLRLHCKLSLGQVSARKPTTICLIVDIAYFRNKLVSLHFYLQKITKILTLTICPKT